MRWIPLYLTVMVIAVCPAQGSVKPTRHDSSRPHNRLSSRRFTYSPWQLSRGGRGRKVPLPPHDSDLFLYSHFLHWAPFPGRRWKTLKLTDPHALTFYEDDRLPLEKVALYFYFRTALNVPDTMRKDSIHLLIEGIDDGMAVFINGKYFWNNPDNRYLGGRADLSIGPILHTGRNSVVLLLVNWFSLAGLGKAQFIGNAQFGQEIRAWSVPFSHRDG